MPVTVLLIEGNDARAQAMRLALETPWQEWHVLRVTTVLQARTLLSSDAVDLVLSARCLADGSAYDVLTPSPALPVVVLLPEGEEAHAAWALRHGFADFVVQDAAQQYLLTLSAQLEEVLARGASRHALQAGRYCRPASTGFCRRLRGPGVFIASAPPRTTFEVLLQEMLALTDSAFGMVGQVEHRPNGVPCLRVHAISDISWDDASRQRYAQVAEQGMVFDNPRSLIGRPCSAASP